jgi:Leucine-rich repeat (LRR) protein
LAKKILKPKTKIFSSSSSFAEKNYFPKIRIIFFSITFLKNQNYFLLFFIEIFYGKKLNQKIQELDLSFNHLSSLPGTLSNLRSISSLNLSNNRITGLEKKKKILKFCSKKSRNFFGSFTFDCERIACVQFQVNFGFFKFRVLLICFFIIQQ